MSEENQKKDDNQEYVDDLVYWQKNQYSPGAYVDGNSPPCFKYSGKKLTCIFSLMFGVVFFIIGVLNIFLVHPFPGILYIIFSFIYFPTFNTFLKKRFSFSISISVRIILGFLVLWSTLAVGDLAEIFGL